MRLIYGFHPILSKLRHDPEAIGEIFLEENRIDQRAQKLSKFADSQNVNCSLVSSTHLQNLIGNVVHQGVVATIVREKTFFALSDVLDNLEEPAFLLVLDGITDPRNLGACLRVADAAGVHAVIAPKDRAVAITDVVSKVACGAAEIIPYCVVTNLARSLREIADRDIHLIGMAEEAEQNLYQANWPVATAFVLGAEGTGLRRLTRENCNQILSIPMYGGVDSLNVATASGICLYEAKRRLTAN